MTATETTLDNAIPLEATRGIDSSEKPIFTNATGFDDAGKIVPIEAWNPEALDGAPTEPDSLLHDTRLETIRGLLAFLALGETNLRKIGMRTAMFSYLVYPNQSQSELAKKLKVSEAAVSKQVKAARIELAAFLRATSRQCDPKSKPPLIPEVNTN